MKKVLYILALAIAALAAHSCDNEFTYPPVVMGDIKGDGSVEAPFNITAAVRQCAKNGETSDQFYFVAGYVVSGSIDPAYGNATWNLYDNLNGDGQKLIAYRVKSFDNQKFTDANAVKEGDYIVIYAPLINYKGNTPETATGGYLYSVNGVIGGTSTPANPTTPGEPKGSGTVADPYNIAKAIEVAKANGQESSVMVYTEGYVASGSIDVSYGNATWDLTDNADGSGAKFKAFRVKSFDNKKFTDANAVKVGDKVVIYAPLINYMGNTPETGSGGYLYSLNGVAGGTTPPEGGDEPVQPGSALYTEAFSNTQGAFIIDNVTLPSDLTYVWQATEKYGMKASAFANNKSHAAESWLISPVFDLAKATGVALTFDTANNKYAKAEDIKTQATLWVSVDGAAWQQLTIPTYGSNADWNFVSSGSIDLSAYAGKKISLGFCYKSTSSASGTWEIKNFTLTGSGSITTATAVVPGK